MNQSASVLLNATPRAGVGQIQFSDVGLYGAAPAAFSSLGVPPQTSLLAPTAKNDAAGLRSDGEPAQLHHPSHGFIELLSQLSAGGGSPWLMSVTPGETTPFHSLQVASDAAPQPFAIGTGAPLGGFTLLAQQSGVFAPADPEPVDTADETAGAVAKEAPGLAAEQLVEIGSESLPVAAIGDALPLAAGPVTLALAQEATALLQPTQEAAALVQPLLATEMLPAGEAIADPVNAIGAAAIEESNALSQTAVDATSTLAELADGESAVETQLATVTDALPEALVTLVIDEPVADLGVVAASGTDTITLGEPLGKLDVVVEAAPQLVTDAVAPMAEAPVSVGDAAATVQQLPVDMAATLGDDLEAATGLTAAVEQAVGETFLPLADVADPVDEVAETVEHLAAVGDGPEPVEALVAAVAPIGDGLDEVAGPVEHIAAEAVAPLSGVAASVAQLVPQPPGDGGDASGEVAEPVQQVAALATEPLANALEGPAITAPAAAVVGEVAALAPDAATSVPAGPAVQSEPSVDTLSDLGGVDPAAGIQTLTSLVSAADVFEMHDGAAPDLGLQDGLGALGTADLLATADDHDALLGVADTQDHSGLHHFDLGDGLA